MGWHCGCEAWIGSGGLSWMAGKMSTLSQVFVCGGGMEEEAEVVKATFLSSQI